MDDNARKVLNDIFVGAQLIKITDSEIVIRRNKETYYFSYDIYDTGCICTYAEVNTNLLIDEKEHPVITKVKYESNINYGDDSCKITFFGGDKAIAEASYCAGSGSGWEYGSYVTIVCRDLNLREVIVEY